MYSIEMRASYFLIATLLTDIIYGAPPFWLQTLPTPSTSSDSNISSFLSQHKNISKTNEPNRLPKFNSALHSDESTHHKITANPERNGKFYRRILDRVVGDIRNQVSDAVKIVSQKRDATSPSRIQMPIIDENEKFVDDEDTTDFIGLSLSEEENSSGPETVFEISMVNSSHANQDGDDLMPPNNTSFLPTIFHNKTQAIATVVFTPLLNVWSYAKQNLRFSPSFSMSRGDSPKSSATQGTSELQDERRGHGDYADSKSDKDAIALNLLPKSSNYIEVDGNARHIAFRNAFAKYSNLVSKDETSMENTDEVPKAETQSNASEDREGLDDNDDDNNNDVDNKHNVEDTENVKAFLSEGLGIYILEIIGTLAGLTWGAISQIQHIWSGKSMTGEEE